ncbi:MAG TPA: hypothetical protein VIP70_09595, partial [Nitrososphaeraceae archaeon]
MSAGIDDDKTSSKNRETDGNNFEGSSRKETKVTSLKIAEAEQRDVGRKIARVDPAVVEKLNITSGDALELSSLGKKTTVLSWP